MYYTRFDPFTRDFQRLTRFAFGQATAPALDVVRHEGDVTLKLTVTQGKLTASQLQVDSLSAAQGRVYDSLSIQQNQGRKIADCRIRFTGEGLKACAYVHVIIYASEVISGTAETRNQLSESGQGVRSSGCLDG